MARNILFGGLIVIAAAAGVAAVAWQQGILGEYGDKSYGAIAACEEATKEALRSPASYVQSWSHFEFRPPVSHADRIAADKARREERCQPNCSDSIDSFFDAYDGNIELNIARKQKRGKKLTDLEAAIVEAKARDAEAIARNGFTDQSALITVEYDADNAYGAKLRSFGICRFDAIGEDRRFTKSDIMFAGPIDREAGQLAKQMAASKG